MIFGMFKKRDEEPEDDDDEVEDDEEELEAITFQGALNGKAVDMSANARLVQVGLKPCKKMMIDSLSRRAEQFRIEPKGERAQVTMQIDGVAYSGGKLAKQEAAAISQMLKLLAGLDPKLRGKHQKGGLKADFQGTPYEIMVEAAPQADGSDRVTVKSRNLKAKLSTPEELGFTPAMKQFVRDISGKRHGFVVAAGSPGSGVTTSLFGVLRSIDFYMHSAYSIGDMGSREIYNITKFEKNEGDSLSTTCERIIRAEGDIIYVDPIRDAETAKQFSTVTDRVCVIGEVPGKDAAHALVQFCEWLTPAVAAANVDAIFSQRLIRTLCNECRTAFRPAAKLLQQVGLPAETKVLYRKGEPPVDEKTGETGDPCEVCGGVGYMGRVSMMECVVMNERMKAFIAEGKEITADQIKQIQRSEGMATIHKDGLRLVAEGKTSLEELQRIFKGG